MKRKIIDIDESLCNGCGECVPNCAEGALQVIDGKVRLISDLFCDGLGACLGHCPTGAITIIEREAEPYDEERVMAERIVPAGAATIRAHLEHLEDHGELGYLATAREYLKKAGLALPGGKSEPHRAGHGSFGGCPGSMTRSFGDAGTMSAGNSQTAAEPQASELRQWPIQLHLAGPRAPYFAQADLLLAADCTAFAVGDFHQRWLRGRSLVIACPKLDDNQDVYVQKLVALIDEAKVNTITVLVMEVPCCGGLVALVQEAARQARRKVPIKRVVAGIQGDLLAEDWL